MRAWVISCLCSQLNPLRGDLEHGTAPWIPRSKTGLYFHPDKGRIPAYPKDVFVTDRLQIPKKLHDPPWLEEALRGDSHKFLRFSGIKWTRVRTRVRKWSYPDIISKKAHLQSHVCKWLKEMLSLQGVIVPIPSIRFYFHKCNWPITIFSIPTKSAEK